MKTEAMEAKKELMAWVFFDVVGVMVAFIAIIASVSYPVLTAASWGL